jgi:predicted ester cyclase
MVTSTPEMLVQRLVAIYSGGDPNDLDELLAPNYVLYGLTGGGTDRAGRKRQLAMFLRAFPDQRVSIDDLVVQGNGATLRWTTRGTHAGPFESPIGTLEPTGRAVTHAGINVMRFADGKVVSEWSAEDMLSLLQQLGARVTAPGPS